MEEFEISEASNKPKTVYISTIFSISLVLLMLGLLGLILVHAKNLSNYVKENIVLNVILTQDAQEAQVLQLQKELNANPVIREVQYINKELAARNLQNDLGEDFVKFLGFNPLSSSMDIYLKADFANSTEINKIKTLLESNKSVKEVVYQSSLVDNINKNINSIGVVILAFAVILLVIAIALINNTIRLAIYAQRFLIKSMQLVGATKNFIRRPFLGYALIHGFLASLIAIILLLGLLIYAQNQIPELKILRNYTEFGIVFISVIVIGFLITGVSTFFAVTKYLKLKTNNLYR